MPHSAGVRTRNGTVDGGVPAVGQCLKKIAAAIKARCTLQSDANVNPARTLGTATITKRTISMPVATGGGSGIAYSSGDDD